MRGKEGATARHVPAEVDLREGLEGGDALDALDAVASEVEDPELLERLQVFCVGAVSLSIGLSIGSLGCPGFSGWSGAERRRGAAAGGRLVWGSGDDDTGAAPGPSRQ